MTVAAIVQARMGSTRFPGKVLAPLCGKPVLQHVLERCRQIKGVKVVCLAIPDTKDNDELEAAATHGGWGDWSDDLVVYRGSELDVLDRYLEAAKVCHWERRADTIMRITADCPLIDPDVCGDVLAKFREGRHDYVSNVCPRTWPKGFDCEVFSFKALKEADDYSEGGSDREHVTPWMQRMLPRINVEAPYNASHVNYCVDYPEDIARLEQVMKEAA